MKSRLSRFTSLTFLGLSLLTLSGCGDTKTDTYQISLEVWGVFDDTDTISQVVSEYTKANRAIKEIKYRKMAADTYKEDLLNAMAAGNGPDIFMIQNTWVPSFADKIVSAPANQISEKLLRDSLVDVVAADFLNAEKQVMAVPLSVDSLALYYNKDILNAAGITGPPKTWDELIKMVPLLTRLDEFGNIRQSAIALGASENINRSSDLLLALMLQYGSVISDPNFGEVTDNQALDFYTQFARLGSPTYTWNLRQHYSIDAFYEGTLGMMINYSYQYPTIRQKNAKLNFATAPLPQGKDTDPVNFANYWGFAVAKNKTQVPDPTNNLPPLTAENYQKARMNEAWQFLSYLTMPHLDGTVRLIHALTGEVTVVPVATDPAKKYLELTQKPAARRDLIDGQKEDIVLGPFVTGNLVAKSWNPGNTEQAEGLMVDTISSVVRGERGVDAALTLFTTRLNQLNRR